MRALPRRLAPRLILLLTLLVALGYGFYAWAGIRTLERQLIAEKTLAADQLSRSITSATWLAMLAGRKDDAYAVMQTMAEHQGVDYVRIFAKEGRVAFSSIPGDDDPVALDAVECSVCHATEPPLIGLDLQQRVRLLEGPEDGRRMALLTPIPNEPSCSTAACHAHPADLHVLGILDVAVELSDVDQKMAQARLQTAGLALIQVLLTAGFLAFFITRLLGRPIRRLTSETARLAAMDLDTPVVVETDSELGDLGVAFDVMREHLREAQAKNEQFTARLEEKVEERGRELASTQEQLIQSDRLASLGQLAASVAHEVNNPISAVHNLAMFLQRILGEDGIEPERLPSFERHLGQIASESARAGRIVQDLLSFSRRSTPQRAPADLNAIVEATLEIAGHRAELERIDIIREFGTNLPHVPCDGSQIQQVVMNLALNAVEAMAEGGRLTVRTGLESATDMAVIQVEDTGGGISPQHVMHVFDPFFSTKSGEKGVGLGLAVAYGIVEAHGGRLSAHSDAGRGTVFTIRLPIHPPTAASAPEAEKPS